MAWFKSQGNQIDPFNAGEPILPWEDPEPIHEDANCELTGESYDGPTKARDNYDAPSSDDPSVSEIVGELFSTDGEPANKRARTRSESRRARKPSATPAPAKKPATAGRIIKWVVVGVVLVNLMPVLVGALSFVVDDVIPDIFGPDEEATEYPLAGHESPDFSGLDTDDPFDYSEQDLAEQAISDFTVARLDAEKVSGSASHAAIAEHLNDTLEEQLGYSAQELSVDASAYADWVLANFTYEVDSVFAFDDGTGSLYFEAKAPSSFIVASDIASALYDYLDEEGLMHAQVARELTPEQQEQVRQVVQGVLDKAEVDTESFASFEFSRVDGEWVMDEEEFTEEMTFVLGIL